MKIKMMTSVAGEGFAVSHGETTDRFSDDECDRFIAAGLAVAVEAEKPKRSANKSEKAVVGTDETAMLDS